MKKENVAVRINEGCHTATELNPISEFKADPINFEIDYSNVPVTSKKVILNGFLTGSILQAEVLSIGKIRIL